MKEVAGTEMTVFILYYRLDYRVRQSNSTNLINFF